MLLIEDEWLVADETAKALRALGVTVEGPVGDADLALRLCERAEVDAALLDINLKGIMAFVVADRLRERGLPFAFVTGYGRHTLPARYADVPVFEKPVNVTAIMRALLQS